MNLRTRPPTFESGESAGFGAATARSGVSGGSVRLAAIERLLVYASRAIVPLAALTPIEARAERERLTGALRAGHALAPRWHYAPPPADDGLRRALDAAESVLARAPEGPLDALYVGRIRELALEAALCAAAGTRELGRLATARYAASEAGRGTPRGEREPQATALCARWLASSGGASSGSARAHPSAGTVRRAASFATCLALRSDDPHAGSLLQRMRAEVGRLGLPFSVQAAPALAALAATGEDVILVATGRMLTAEVVERTVLHEVHGHAWPRVRARYASSVLFRAGTARGVDEQEGRALWLERRTGWLGTARKRQLATRHDAACAMVDGASFADVVCRLVRMHGASPEEAVVVAERVFRGSDGTFPGLGRERVYLPALLRVQARLEDKPDDEPVLASGQIAVDAVDALRPYAPPVEHHSTKRMPRRGDERD
ncbi:MAG TPA: tyrosine/phenylalanine carboxypeptidase domain-containing protein [Polyangiaceae bacterium]|nr:tyrosine/phenylalanine carboxypeptidase domain-containing protein [Polyangiaceae bacterium]